MSTRIVRGPVGALKRILVGLADAHVTYGVKATEHLEYMGVSPSKIVTGCNVGDIAYYGARVTAYRATKEHQVRRKQYPPTLLLYVGQLIPRKGCGVLLHALLDTNDSNWGLVIVGDGKLKSPLEQLCFARRMDRVWFVGFQDRDRLAQWYSLADVFVLPSLREVGSIVLSEALASGCYALGSAYDGSTWNLIQPGQNGEIIDPKNPERLRTTLGQVIEGRPFEGQRQAIVDSMRPFSVESYAEAFAKAVFQAAGCQARAAG